MSRDFLIGLTITVAQHERDSQRVGHGVKDTDDAIPIASRLEFSVGSGPGLHRHLPFGCELLNIHHDHSPRLPQVIEAVVHFDALQPGPELRPPLETTQPKERFDEDLLRQIFGVVWRAGDDAAIRRHKPLISTDERVERACVAPAFGPRQLDQLVIRRLVKQLHAPLAPAEPPRNWAGTAGVGVSITGGNSDTMNNNLAFDLTRTPRARNVMKRHNREH